MEFTGKDALNNTELKIKMPKFGEIQNKVRSVIMEDNGNKENILRSIDYSNNKEEKKKGILELLALHPYPRYSGPFEGSIISGWPHRPTIKTSNDYGKKFLYYVSFTHAASQPCGNWKLNEDNTYNKNDPLFEVTATNVELWGPASTMTSQVLYPCENKKCIIQCPCNLCTSSVKPCESNCARSPCEVCNQQCKEHNIDLERNYKHGDSFTVPFYSDSLTEENISLPTPWWSCAISHFVKHAGIPRNCDQCQVDLLDHQVNHHVLHYRCKFCRDFLRLVRENPLENVWKVYNIEFLDNKWLGWDDENKKTVFSCDERTCKFCYKVFPYPANRKYHEKTEHIPTDETHQCQECSESFGSIFDLNIHQKVHSEISEGYSCIICKEQKYSELRLKRHLELTHNILANKPFQCEDCTMSFSSEVGLNHHRRKHIKSPKEYSCGLCNKSYTSEISLKRHIESVHSNHNREIKCQHCEKTFTRVDNLSRHEREIHKVSSFNLSFTTKYHRPWKCEICVREFLRKEHLEIHISSVHETASENVEEPFSCKICNLKCSNLTNLRRHRDTHDEHKAKIKCAQCRKSFISEENLNEHIKMKHTLPEVKCKECGLKMKNKWTLSRHMKSTHEENKEVNKCGSCGKTFGRKDNLMKHIQHYH